MSTAKAVAVQGSAGEAAYERVRPLIEAARQDLIKVATAIGEEYRALPKGERQVFCTKLGWSQGRVQEFARIGETFPSKLKVITSRRREVGIESLGIEHMREISSTPDETLQLAADAGMFDKPVSKRDIITLRKTGRIPIDKPKAKPTTDLQKVRALMADAEGHMTKAAITVGKIVTIMYDAGITDAKGKEATALIQAFEKLCTEMASANPTTSKRAFAILRGEA